jgi:excisionase family DNA binding protein
MASVLTLEEVARYLHVHPSTIYRLLKKKELPAFKVGSDWRFNLESIDRWRDDAERAHSSIVAPSAKADGGGRERPTPRAISRGM